MCPTDVVMLSGNGHRQHHGQCENGSGNVVLETNGGKDPHHCSTSGVSAEASAAPSGGEHGKILSKMWDACERQGCSTKRHNLRVHIDFREARFQAQKQNKRFIQGRTYDTIHGKQLQQPLQLVVDNIIIDKVPRMQYFYVGILIAFIDNKFFAVGNATNNQGHAISIILDPHEPLDDFSKPYRELVYLPAYVLVYVPNAHMDQLYPDLPPKVLLLTPSTQTHRIRLEENRYKLQNGKNISHVSVSRMGMRWIGVHAVTQYFSQGMSLAGKKCIVDLRIPAEGGPLGDYAESVLVMLSRHKDDTNWALLHPLWTPGNHLERLHVIDSMRKLLCRDLDLHAELRRIQRVESDIIELALQKILAEHPQLAKILLDS